MQCEAAEEDTMYTHRLPLWLLAVITLGCGAASAPAVPDPDGGEVDAAADGPGDASVEADVEIPDDVDVETEPDGDLDSGTGDCAAQEATNNLEYDCEACNQCDARPYLWTGGTCTYDSICCECLGPDCGAKFATFDECLEAYAECPLRSSVPSEFRDARLIWTAPGGFAGLGPALVIEGNGLAQHWSSSPGDPDPASTSPDYEKNLGTEETDELFRMLEAINYSALPHETMPGWDCYPSLQLSLCEGCETIRLDYNGVEELRPEMNLVYSWLNERLCRGVDALYLLGNYCWLEW